MGFQQKLTRFSFHGGAYSQIGHAAVTRSVHAGADGVNSLGGSNSVPGLMLAVG